MLTSWRVSVVLELLHWHCSIGSNLHKERHLITIIVQAREFNIECYHLMSAFWALQPMAKVWSSREVKRKCLFLEQTNLEGNQLISTMSEKFSTQSFFFLLGAYHLTLLHTISNAWAVGSCSKPCIGNKCLHKSGTVQSDKLLPGLAVRNGEVTASIKYIFR